jgi:CheY-like chemotaxis protein
MILMNRTTSAGGAEDSMLNGQEPSASIAILVIEDDKDQAEFINRILRECSWVNHVKLMHDGEEALELLHSKEHRTTGSTKHYPPYQPQVIILDLHLPNVHGLELLRRLKSDPLTDQTPIIVLSASYVAKDMKKSYDLGAVSFLRKPVDPSDLIWVMEYSLRDRYLL